MPTKRKERKPGRPFTFDGPAARLNAWVPGDVVDELERRAVDEGRSLSNYVARVLTAHVNEESKL